MRKILCYFTFMILSISIIYAGEFDPMLNGGKKWRIGYIEGGEWPSYQETFRYMIKHLIKYN